MAEISEPALLRPRARIPATATATAATAGGDPAASATAATASTQRHSRGRQRSGGGWHGYNTLWHLIGLVHSSDPAAGGQGGEGSDAEEEEEAEYEWVLPELKGPCPGDRGYHAAAASEDGSKVFIFGGIADRAPTNRLTGMLWGPFVVWDWKAGHSLAVNMTGTWVCHFRRCSSLFSNSHAELDATFLFDSHARMGCCLLVRSGMVSDGVHGTSPSHTTGCPIMHLATAQASTGQARRAQFSQPTHFCHCAHSH